MTDYESAKFVAIVDQLAAIIRDSLDRLDAPITEPMVRKAIAFTARLLIQMDANPSQSVLATHAAIQAAIEGAS